MCVIYVRYIRVHTSGMLCLLAGVLPKRSDLLHVAALGVCLFFNQLMYILGISLSGVLVATCMQPTIPVFTAMLAVCLRLESGSVQKFFGIGLAVLGSMSMVSASSAPSRHNTTQQIAKATFRHLDLRAKGVAWHNAFCILCKPESVPLLVQDLANAMLPFCCLRVCCSSLPYSACLLASQPQSCINVDLLYRSTTDPQSRSKTDLLDRSTTEPKAVSKQTC